VVFDAIMALSSFSTISLRAVSTPVLPSFFYTLFLHLTIIPTLN
jgi:hypothetical protein